jgi:hypothetical protein
MLAAALERSDPVGMTWWRCFCLGLWRAMVLARADAKARAIIAAQQEWRAR